MTVTYTGRIDANPHLAACFIPVIFVDPNRGGFLVYRKSLELYYPLSFFIINIFFFIKLYKSDEDFRDISSKILLLLSPLLSTIPSSHAEYSPFEGTFKNTFQLSIQLPLRKLTYSPLESFIPAAPHQISHIISFHPSKNLL